MSLTIGMATVNEPDDLYATLKALEVYFRDEYDELIVVDNAPESLPVVRTQCEQVQHCRYIHAPQPRGTAAPRDRVFRESSSEVTMCIDSHIFLEPGSLRSLSRYFAVAGPECRDLVQGPELSDGRARSRTHMNPQWRAIMYGTWEHDKRAVDPDGAAFEIPMHGLGLFAMRTKFWPGFNPGFVGFGGEEGYIHEKVRRAGGRCVCLPGLGWTHKFRDQRTPTPYPNFIEERLRNYCLGWTELGRPLDDVAAAFRTAIPAAVVAAEVGKHGKKVSCVCPTFGRAGTDRQFLLEQSIGCFLSQTWSNAELIVINDDPNINIEFEHDRVQIVNVSKRMSSLGAKRNFGLRLATGYAVTPWDDDDISLPTRLATTLEVLGDADYCWAGPHWFDDRGTMRAVPGLKNPHMPFGMARRSLLLATEYPDITMGEDQALHATLNEACAAPADGRTRVTAPNISDPLMWYYVYRWGHGNTSGAYVLQSAPRNSDGSVRNVKLVPRGHDYADRIYKAIAEGAGVSDGEISVTHSV